MRYGLFNAGAAALLFVLGHALMGSSLDVAFLASDVHFAIGGHHIVAPVVALRGPAVIFDFGGRKPSDVKSELQAARDPSHPMSREEIDLSIREYRYASENSASLGICPLLTRKWSTTLCRGEHRGLLTRLPQDFSLVARASVEVLRDHRTVGGERVYDQISDMTLRSDQTEIGCDKQSRFCTAAVEVLPGLLAVWFVWSDDVHGVTAKQMAEPQGIAIVQFVRRAIGRTEDATLITAE
jgi:hypothetical protein